MHPVISQSKRYPANANPNSSRSLSFCGFNNVLTSEKHCHNIMTEKVIRDVCGTVRSELAPMCRRYWSHLTTIQPGKPAPHLKNSMYRYHHALMMSTISHTMKTSCKSTSTVVPTAPASLMHYDDWKSSSERTLSVP